MRHSILIHDLPKPGRRWVSRKSLKNDLSGTLQHRTVGDVRMTCNPPTIRCAKENISRMIVKRIFERYFRTDHVTRTAMHHPFGLASGTRRVQHKQRILRIAPSGFAGGGLAVDNVRPADIPCGTPFVWTPASAAMTHARHLASLPRKDNTWSSNRITQMVVFTAKPSLWASSTAASAIRFKGMALVPRITPSAVIKTPDWASMIRPAKDSAENPPNTTECTAPRRAQANIATGSWTTMGK
mmetsp:Transcript_98203/g.262341  ORF Transcript_98203/g.262341 Transcript_98203/m.262341 type:complete len:241 (+) Transcript_98203:2689-3411(+)